VSLGVLFGIVLCVFVFIRQPSVDKLALYACTCGLSILTAITVGATMGVTVPLLLHRLGFDPAIAASPFVQTANDVTGACILYIIANALGLLA
jgi:magnesium transporter